MTFYEAALRVLEAAGHPMHVDAITQQSVQKNLLSHVGKTPEQTMLSRLVAMARRPRDRRVMVTAKDTFALSEWQVPEDAAALSVMVQPEVSPEEGLPPYRPVERHPEPRADMVRASGRGADRKRREERPRKRRFPPIPDVVFEILSAASGPVLPQDIASRARERELASDELSNEQILTALLEDNQRRIDAGRRPQFILEKDTGAILLEKAGAPSEAPPLELQAAFAQALGIPLEGGRPVLPRRRDAVATELPPDAVTPAMVRQTAKEGRRSIAALMRRRLSELDHGTLEKSCVRMLQGLGFRELKVAKRSKDGPLLTARKREGSLELRYAVRVGRGSGGVDRRVVQELRRELPHYGANVGLLLSLGEARGDARAEATAAGALVMLWCGDALGDRFLEASAGVRVTHISLYEIDDRFFEVARVDAAEALRRREERHRERDALAPVTGQGPASEEGDVPSSEAPLADGGDMPAERPPVAAAPGEDFGDDGGEGEGEGADDEGGDDADLEAATSYAGGAPSGSPPGQPGLPGQGRRRRRRRRGRRGRGPRPEGGPQQAGGAPGAPSGSPPADAPAPPPPPSSSEGSGNPA
jgi:ribonuclease E